MADLRVNGEFIAVATKSHNSMSEEDMEFDLDQLGEAYGLAYEEEETEELFF